VARQADFFFDFMLQGHQEESSLAGYAGYEFRGKADIFADAPKGAFHWGTGLGFPTRSPVRLTTELNGFVPSSDTATLTPAGLISLVGIDGTIRRASPTPKTSRARPSG